MKWINRCTPFLLSLACMQISAAPGHNDSKKIVADNDRTDEDYFSNYRYGDEKNIPGPNMYMENDGNPETPSDGNYPDSDY
jgi:hypothetical protein